MNRRAVTTVLIGALIAVLFAAITTSGAVPLAEGPPTFLDNLEVTPNVVEVEIESEIAEGEIVEREQTEPSPLIEAIIRTIFYAFIIIAGVLAAAYLWHHRLSLKWTPRRRRRRLEDFDMLADVASTITADAAAQRAALRRGRPRHAIVECWLRLEAAVVDAGVEHDPAATSAELTERVLAQHDIDPTAIGTLAALYREARFSDHDMGEDSRREAIAALDAVHAGLDQSVTTR